MDKRRNMFGRSVAVFAGFVGLIAFCDVARAVDVPALGPGVTRIAAKHVGNTEMPAALFDHETHVARVREEGGDCVACHTSLGKEGDAGAFPFSIVLSSGGESKDAVRDAWHEACASCHGKHSAAPAAAACHSCHNAEALAEDRLPVVFNRSLHDVHITSKHISPVAPQRTDADVSDTPVQNCGACHSVFVSDDTGKGKAVYVRGTEDAASFYKTDSSDAMELASIAHNTCVACHVETMAAKDGETLALPVACVDCHSLEGQAKFPVVENPTRLLRGQPNSVLLAEQLADTANSLSSDPKAALKPVSFDHAIHEDVASCSQCHGMKIEKSEYGKVPVVCENPHDLTSSVSCVGCHAQKAAEERNCAGCHSALTFTTKDSCIVCHRGEVKKDGPAFLNFFVAEPKPIDPADVPEKVTIGSLANEYQPVELPHRKIYTTMLEGMKDSSLPAAFHVNSACNACHHNIPNANIINPPSCASCHEKDVRSVTMEQRPPLKQAYHQMCMGCHSAMDVKPASSECAGCHALKGADANEDTNKNKQEVL